MFRTIYLILLFSTSLKGYCQYSKGVVVDSASGQAIQYATIYIKSDPRKGTYSDEKGYFQIKCSPLDTLCISSIGYHGVSVVTAGAGYINHYTLIKDIVTLPSVLVSTKKQSTEISLGYYQSKKDITYPGTPGGKVCVLMNPVRDAGKYLISSLFFSLDRCRIGEHSRGSFRILLFTIDSTVNEPIHQNLLPVELVFEKANTATLLKVDVAKYNIIYPPTDLYIGLEWLGEKNSTLSANICPCYFQSYNTSPFKTLNSFFGSAYYDPMKKKENATIIKKTVPNFGLIVTRIN
jgi:hypothetical protein